MSDETLIADLIEAGCPANLVGRVANEIARQHRTTSSELHNIAATSTTTIERKREYNRQRQRLVRSGEWDNNRTTATTPTIYIEDTNTNTNKKERKSGSLCPDNFRPTESHYQAGTLLGLSAAAVDGLCDDMRAWSHTNANRQVARKADWGLALHGWIRRQHGNVAAPNKPATPVVTDEEYARLKAKYDAKVARTA